MQRFFCNRCGKSYSQSQPLEGVRIDTKQAALVIQLLVEGSCIRSVSRITGLNQRTVLNILTAVGAKCERLLSEKIRNVSVEDVELDELYSFVYTLPDNTLLADEEHGEQYLYLASDRKSKLILHHLVAKRTGENCGVFLRELKARVAGRFQLSTDGFLGYTGPRGAVARTFGQDIDYGVEIKQFGRQVGLLSAHTRARRKFNPTICLWTKRIAWIGEPDRDKINTSHAERLNVSVRHFTRRFTRCTPAFSKTLRNHKAAAALFTCYFNFCRVHSAHKQTPAVAAGIVDRAWTAEDLVLATI